MTAFDMPTFASPGFAIATEAQGSTLTLRFRGNADMSTIESLDAYLRRVHAVVTARSGALVVVDFRSLEFMNSSCFKCFVEWIGQVQDLPVAEQYRIVFDSNREMHWQRRSLNALRCFAMEVVTVDAR